MPRCLYSILRPGKKDGRTGNLNMSFKQECQRLYNQYVAHYRRGNAKGCASLFAEHAEMFSPFGPPAIGRQAIEDAHSHWVEEDGAEAKNIIVSQAGSDGNIGWCLAEFSEGTEDGGVSLNVLVRQTDGRWLITHCSLNET